MSRYPAPAKINLHLRVTAILENGYHALDTSFVYVDVGDELDIEPAGELEVSCSQPHLNGPDNLVYRLLDAFRQAHDIADGLRIHVEKKLPEQAGLGGGSSDAATALMVANRLWGTNLSTDELIRFATPFGADIPCFLFGRASIAHGIGEHLDAYPDPLPGGVLLLAHPGVGLSTPEVFRHFDEHHAEDRPLTPQGGKDTIRAQSVSALGENDLEPSACALSAPVACLLQEMRTATERAWMSGSGSTCVALLETPQAAEALERKLKQKGVAAWTHIGSLQAAHPLEKC